MTVRAARVPVGLAIEILGAFAAAAVVVRLGSAGDGPGPSLAAVAAVVLGSFVVARAADGMEETRARFMAVAAGLLLLAVIAYLEYGATAGALDRSIAEDRYVIAGIVALALILLRGLARWSGPFDASDALPSAALAVGAIALAAVVDPPARGPHAFGVIAVIVFLLAWCLLALCQTAAGDEDLSRFAARWSAALGVVLGVAGGLTIAVAAFDPHTLGVLSPALGVLARGLVYVLGFVLRPFVLLISFIFDLIPLHLPKQMHDVAQPPPPPAKKEHGDTPAWLQALGYAFAGLGGFALLLGFLAALWFAVRRRGRKPRVEEHRSAIERDGTLADDLRALFTGIMRRPRSTPQSSVEIRRLYGEMLARAADDGLERAAAATPLQFAPRLEERYGPAPGEITGAFVASRYGAAEIAPQDVRRMRADWQQAIREG